MNESKFGMNFDVANTYRIVSKRVHVGKDGVSFLRWAGLLINCQTLEIQADYTKLGAIHDLILFLFVSMLYWVMIHKKLV